MFTYGSGQLYKTKMDKLERMIEIGKQLGLSGEGLRTFIEQREEKEKEEKREAREEKKEAERLAREAEKADRDRHCQEQIRCQVLSCLLCIEIYNHQITYTNKHISILAT